MKNLTAACEIKKRLGDSCKTKIETAMIINKFNESQEFDYIEKMNSLGVDRVKVSKLQISPNEGKDWFALTIKINNIVIILKNLKM